LTDRRALDPTILREYDIRGVVGETLTTDDVRAIGRAFGSILRDAGGKTAAVGYDGRLSSPDLEAALTEGLVACGIKVFRIGLGPSLMLYFATHKLKADAGLMITGSHNPSDYNGIKMTLQGRPFFGADIQELGRRAATGDFVKGRGKAKKRKVINHYVKRLIDDYDGFDGLRVAWDPGNGAAGEVLERLVGTLPGEHWVINGDIDGTFPAHHPDPTVEENLTQLKELVAEKRCELGIGFDGDGDRIGVVDAKGRVLWGDLLLVVLAEEVLAEQPGAPIISDVKASRVFFDEIERIGGRSVQWKTGHSHMKAKMAEIGAPLAGEVSGHIFFKHRYYGYDDALYAAVRLLSCLVSGGRSLESIYDGLPKLVNTPELRFDCDDDRKFSVVDEVRDRLTGVAGIDVIDIDGVRVENEDGWWLLRASNTQPVLVARCESADGEGLDRLKATLGEQLRLSGIVTGNVKLPDYGRSKFPHLERMGEVLAPL